LEWFDCGKPRCGERLGKVLASNLVEVDAG
jgi:hypothetical protein